MERIGRAAVRSTDGDQASALPKMAIMRVHARSACGSL